MNASQKPLLSKPEGEDAIKLPALAYFRARTRRKLHTLVLDEFKNSGITQAILRRRLKKDAAQISRLLQSPGNWSLDTVSDLLFAIRGAELSAKAAHPFDAAARNHRSPEWMEGGVKSSNTSKSSESVLLEEGQKLTIVKVIRQPAAAAA